MLLQTKYQNKTKGKKKKLIKVKKLLKRQHLFLNAFESRICPIKKPTQRKTTKTLRTKQILHRIPISLAQVKPGKTSEDSHGI